MADSLEVPTFCTASSEADPGCNERVLHIRACLLRRNPFNRKALHCFLAVNSITKLPVQKEHSSHLNRL